MARLRATRWVMAAIFVAAFGSDSGAGTEKARKAKKVTEAKKVSEPLRNFLLSAR